MPVKYKPIKADKSYENFAKEIKAVAIPVIEKHFKRKDIKFAHTNVNSGICCRVSRNWEIELIFFQDGF